MENSEAPKARRPLPTPGAPVTAVRSESTPSVVPAASFYASPKPPPLPSRHKNHGSSHTSYVAPPSQDPPHSSPPESYREPELVTEEPIEEEDGVAPNLVPPAEQSWDNTTSYDVSAGWDNNPTWNNTVTGWDNSTGSEWATGGNAVGGIDFDAMDFLSSGRLEQEFTIDGRATQEEALWWNPEERDRHRRPGPGILAPILAEELHNSNHSLFSVNITGSPSTAPLSVQRDASASSIITTAPMSDSPAPSENDIRMSIPHPNAYFCPKDNGWVILSWKSSSVAPPLARSYLETTTYLPDQSRRRRTPSCIEDTGQPFGKANRTHHFHKYERAVDSHKLTPPFLKDEWESVKQKRRTGAIIGSDLDVRSVKPDDADSVDEFGGSVTDEGGRLMDLYICCQCSFYCVASGVLSGVIPKKYLDELQRDRRSHPGVGKTAEQSIALTIETMLTAIENRLWKGISRSIKVLSSGFQSKVGWNSNAKRLFELLGFVEDCSAQDLTLRPPSIETTTLQGKKSRRRLLRAWVELSAWVSDFKRVHARHFIDWKEFRLHVQLDSAREMYQTAVGAHPDQIPRGGLSDTLSDAIHSLEPSWKGLGLTATTYSPELVGFAYLAQCRCDPAGTVLYFSYLTNIAKVLHECGSGSQLLQDLLAMEQSRERFTVEEVHAAAATLGFGAENVLHVDYDEDIPDEFVENAWKDCIKRSWRDHDHGAENHRLANDSFRILADHRNSVRLRTVWDNGKIINMNPEKAYDTLEVPKDVEDYMLITVYSMRLEETPAQLEKMKEAMFCIAEVRDSDRLRQFITTGTDPGEIVAPTRPDLPRGLNQLGNTCYLNSLLQYFYTIKELREAVVPMSKLDLKALDNEKLTEDDLKRHRVGGRLVTRREITRSRKFINQLADLFYNLEYSENPAVTPTVELAKLALVTSRDEEEDEIDKGGTDSSNDTDATLVDDGPSMSIETPNSPKSLGKSVLGKRGRENDRKNNEMDVESPIAQSPTDKDGFVMISRKDNEAEGNFTTEASSSKIQSRYSDEASPSVPKPEPRKRASDSTMMFGKQHDVAECMDNCMFQIETALLRFDGGNDVIDKTSVVKRLFYGKIRQRITSVDGQHSRSSMHEKEDLFSHLPVNVANDGIDIYDGLSGYFDDVVEFQGRKARMEVTLVDLPPILQVQLQRVQFNRETLQPYKSQAYVKFGEDLYMDRFMDNADPAKKAKSKTIQAELNVSRERLRLLVEGQETPFTTSMEHTKAFLSGIQIASTPGIDDSLLQQLNDEQVRIRDEIDRLRVRIDALKNDLESLWNDSTEAAYELTSVFIHRGSSPSWGHYFFYSRHLPGNPDSWFKYNDSDVSVVAKDEVLADTTGSTANPYLLVFARKGSDLVDTVKRFDPSKLEVILT